jgi:hypothetical protein
MRSVVGGCGSSGGFDASLIAPARLICAACAMASHVSPSARASRMSWARVLAAWVAFASRVSALVMGQS